MTRAIFVLMPDNILIINFLLSMRTVYYKSLRALYFKKSLLTWRDLIFDEIFVYGSKRIISSWVRH